MENTQRLWIMYIVVFSLDTLTANELTAERYLIEKATMDSSKLI